MPTPAGAEETAVFAKHVALGFERLVFNAILSHM